MKILNIGIIFLFGSLELIAVPKMPDGPSPIKSTPVAAPIPVKPVIPQASVIESKEIAPKPIIPKAIVAKSVPVIPVNPTVAKVMPKIVPAPVVAKAVAVAPVLTAPAVAVKPFVQPEVLASQVVGVITVKNKSKYKASWTGWKTKYKTENGQIHYKLHTLKTAHELQPITQNKVAQTLQEYTVHNLPPQSFVEGVSHLLMSGQPVLVEYQGSAWMPGVTDAIYITSQDGTIWTLDKKAMDKDYKKINFGIKKSKKVINVEKNPLAVTSTTKAASVPVVLKDKKNRKKFKNIKE